MNIPCDARCNPCIDPAEPTANYSTEDPDVDHSFCYGSGNGSLQLGPGRNWDVDNCKITWGTISCVGDSEEDCQSCLQTYRWTCDPENPTDPPTPPVVDENNHPVRLYGNFPISAQVTCPDGGTFTYTVPFARFFATSQTAANQMAASYAAREARLHKLCLGPLTPSQCCEGVPYVGTIRASGKFVNTNRNIWQFIGVPPSGVSPSFPVGGPVFTLSGIPTSSGSSTFTLRLILPNGDQVQKTYTLCVVGIHPTSLLSGTVGTAYSRTLTADSCATTPLSWQVFSGSLPDGLTLDETTGVISGTPTTDGTYSFTIQLQTQAT